MSKKFLDDVYTDAKADVAGFYDTWAATYEDEVTENAYVTPARVAAALADAGTPHDARILDFGCGTGLGGDALVAQGFTLIDGTDLSAQMLAHAEAKQIYGRLWHANADAPLAIPFGTYSVIAAIGVVSPGAGPPGLLADLAACLDGGGRLAFSFNDHALADPSYIDALHDLRDRDMSMLHESYGEHLPKRGMRSTVYLFEKA
ncbi:MAG: methyltransferase domain-containing protein [Pseudomonadota bacterium]